MLFTGGLSGDRPRSEVENYQNRGGGGGGGGQLKKQQQVPSLHIFEKVSLSTTLLSTQPCRYDFHSNVEQCRFPWLFTLSCLDLIYATCFPASVADPEFSKKGIRQGQLIILTFNR